VAAALVAYLAPVLSAMAPMAWALVPATAWAIGLVLGMAQWMAIRDVIGGIEHEDWSGATLYGSLVAGVITLAVASWLVPSSVDARLLLPLAMMAGAIGGGLLGGAQALVLRGHLPGMAAWMAINALGWAAAFGVGFLGLSLASSLQALPRALLVLLTGAVAGVVSGLLTGGVLTALAREAGLILPVRGTDLAPHGRWATLR
jgi:hypothetical protein